MNGRFVNIIRSSIERITKKAKIKPNALQLEVQLSPLHSDLESLGPSCPIPGITFDISRVGRRFILLVFVLTLKVGLVNKNREQVA